MVVSLLIDIDFSFCSDLSLSNEPTNRTSRALIAAKKDLDMKMTFEQAADSSSIHMTGLLHEGFPYEILL